LNFNNTVSEVDKETISLHHAQKEIIYSQMSTPNSPHTNVGGYIRIEGKLDIDRFQQALNLTMDTFDIFDIAFSEHPNGDIYQYTNYNLRVPAIIVDLTNLPDESNIVEYCQDAFNTPFISTENKNYDLRLICYKDNIYYWLIRFNHAIQDGAGIVPLVKKCTQIYRSLTLGISEQSGEKINFLSLVEESKHYLASEKYEKDKSYWLSRFEPSERDIFPKISPSTSTTSRRKSYSLEDSLRCKLYHVSSTNNISIQHLYVAAIGIYSAKRYGISVVPMGSVVHNRNSKIKRDTAGMLTGNLATSLHVLPQENVKELVGRIKKQQRSDFKHQRMPISHLQKALGRDRLFEIMFNYQPLDFSADFSGAMGSTYYLSSNEERHPLQIRLCDYGDHQSMNFIIDYRTDCFDDNEADIFYQRLNFIIEQLLNHELNIKVEDIQVYLPSEMNIVEQFSYGPEVLLPENTLIEYFQKSANFSGVALNNGKESIGFRDLNKQCKILAHRLLALACKDNPRIAICMERSIRLPKAIYASIYTGGAYIPIEPNLPKNRISYMLEKAESDLIICDKNVFPLIENTGLPIFVFDENEDLYLKSETYHETTSITVEASDPCYIIYTSGTTGKPKGAINSHRAVLNRLHWMQSQYNFNHKDLILQKTPFGFDVSAWEFLLPIFCGATLYIAKEQGHKDAEYLIELITENNINTVHFVPSMLSAFLQFEESRNCVSLERIICSGEALPPQLKKKLFEILPNTNLYNLYGPTEAAIDVTHWDCNEKYDGPSIPIGYPINNVQLLVCDHQQNPVPVGVAGELFIGGLAPALGYINMEQETNERFKHLPCKKGRFYQTGDLVKWIQNGALVYLGRIDEQVKIRGQRIELGEIESVMQNCPEVLNVAVTYVESRHAIYAFVVHQKNIIKSINKIELSIAQQLPEFMHPAKIILVDEIPLSKNGKVDKQALINNLPAHSKTGKMPVTLNQQVIIRCISEVLKLDTVYLDDNFFAIGGDSILALKIIAKLKKNGLSLKLADILRASDITDIAKNTCEPIKPAQQPVMNISIVDPSGKGRECYQLSDMQTGVIFQSALHPETGVYHDVFTFIYDQSIVIPTLQKALDALTDEHEILRTVFSTVDNNRCQIVIDNQYHEIVTIIHKNVEQDLQTSIEQFTQQEKTRDFDFSSPPIRVFVHQSSSYPNLTGITFSFHLSILDGWSIHSLNTSLIKYYNQLSENKSLSISTKPKYRSFIEQEKLLASSEQGAQFWRQKGLSFSAPIWLKQEKSGYVKKHFTLGNDYASAIQALAKSEKVHERDVYLAIHFQFMSTLLGTPCLTSNVVMNGRPEVENADLMLGQFLCSPPLTIDTQIGQAGNLVKAVANEIESLFDYRYFPLSQIQKLWGETFGTILFNYVNFHVYENSSEKPLGQPKQFIRFEETNFLFETNIYRSGLNANTQVELILDRQATINLDETEIRKMFDQAINKVLGQPNTSIEANPVIEGESIDYPFNNLVDAYRTASQQHKDRIALIEGDKTVTYQALAENVDALAQFMVMEYGIKPGDYVAIVMNRSINLVTGIYATITMGCAYIPVDPDYPDDRIRYMLNDAKPAIVLTDQTTVTSMEALGYRCLNLDALYLDTSAPIAPNVLADSSTLKYRPCYMIYTSGSTGNPKGVINGHYAVANRIQWMQSEYKLEADDRILQKTPYSFDVSVWEFLWPLFYGATLVIAKPRGHMDVNYLVSEIIRSQVTTIHFVPSMLKLFISNIKYKDCLSLKRIICSGEALPPALISQVRSSLPVEIYNLYGPTEAAIDVTHFNCEEYDGEGTVPIGQPIANSKLYIMNKHQKAVHPGVPGELVIAGTPVALGYYNKPELTKERFIKIGEEQCYLTGDLVRLKRNNNIEYLGRIDQQVKINGQRIELEEIERVIETLPIIQNAVATVWNTKQGVSKIVVYYQPMNLNKSDIEVEIRETINLKLPSYMKPSALVMLSEIPLSPSGKLDRKSLPEPSFNLGTSVKPNNDNEMQLLSIFQTLIFAQEFGIEDDFFAMGGDSMTALKLVSKAQEMGFNMSIHDLYELKTVREIANKTGLRDLKVEPDQDSYPWLPNRAAVFRQKTDAVNITDMNCWTWSSLLRLNHHIDESTIHKAIELLIQDFPTLRMSTRFEDVSQTHHTLDPSQIAIESLEFSSIENDTIQALAIERIHRINLENTPIIFTIIQEKSNLSCVLVVFHHLLMDSIGMGIMASQFDSYLSTLRSGHTPKAPNLNSMSNYATRLYKAAQLANTKECIARYQNVFSEGGELVRHSNGSIQNRVTNGVNVIRKLKISSSPWWEQTQNITTQKLIEAALIYSVMETFDKESLKVELRTHGRKSNLTDRDASTVIGYLSESVPIQLSKRASERVNDSLVSMCENIGTLMKHHESFFAHRYLSKDPQVNALFAKYQDAEIAINVLPLFNLESTNNFHQDSWYQKHVQDKLRKSNNLDRVFLLDIKAEYTEHEIVVSLSYHQGLFDLSQIELMLDLTEHYLN